MRCFLLIVCLVVVPTPASAEFIDGPPIRAIYGLDRRLGPFRGMSTEEIANWLGEHRVNAVFGGYRDRALVRALRRRKIRIFAEIALFAGKKHWKNHPGSRPIDARGRRIGREKWYAGVCPNQAWLREAKLKQIERLVRDHGVDGVWLDFIRYPVHWEVRRPRLRQTCFCPVCLARFVKDTRIRIPASAGTTAKRAAWILDNHNERFVRWKTERIAAFVERARQVVKAINPKVTLGLFGVPWRTDERDDAIRTIVAQDYAKLAPFVDVLSPMVYHRMVGKRVGWIADFSRYLRRLTDKPILPIIQACSLPDALSDAEFATAVRYAMEAPSAGVIVFSFKHFFKEKRQHAWQKAVGKGQ
jgi:uncharacterized lipoprotein YddW (UPF0748 family)